MVQLNFESYLLFSKVVLFIFILETNTTSLLTLNTTGYDNCIFNLVVAPLPEEDILSSVDFVGSFVNSNPGTQPWTISIMSANDSDVLFLSANLIETCSINILISISGCLPINLPFIFDSRAYNPHNILYIAQGKPSEQCSGYGSSVGRSFGNWKVNFDIILLKLADDNQTVAKSFIWCKGCWRLEKEIYQVRGSFRNLNSMRRVSSYLKGLASLPGVGVISHHSSVNFTEFHKCKHFYKYRDSTQPHRICCFHRHLLMENVAAKLNYSVEYIDPTAHTEFHNIIFRDFDRLDYYSAVAVLGLLTDWVTLSPDISPVNMIFQKPMESITSLFLYCTTEVKREGFDFRFWILPFDTVSWLFIGASVIVLTCILRGQWFPVFAILMRQDCRILMGWNKLFVLFILTTIILTYGYEGIISSLLTAKPPVFVYETLKEAFVAGYKIYGYVDTDWEPYAAIFQEENITDIDKNTVNTTWLVGVEEEQAELAKCNSTF